MNIQYWHNLIVAAVESKDTDQLDSLVRHLAACEQANQILRAKGYGMPGQMIHDIARQVPHVKE